TKPLGTGVILAGLMLGKVNGETLYKCLDLMTRSSEKISQTLKHYVSTMTDVTGFGLAGHLQNILVSSRVGATLESESIPMVEGAIELSADGVRSSLWKANSNIPLKVINNTAAINLLFDPQTSGGLLATISEENLALLQSRADEVASELYPIGKITEGPPLIEIS
ncbi:MAG: AIR synthase-related protein, partial [Rhodobacteraceae bacterium]|nr:AIR synthase-related protein [Paracoccaceae bacterium]